MSKKKIFISCNYLVLPVSEHVENRNLLFYQNGTLADDIVLRLDYVNPEYNVYYPVSKWNGETIEIEILQGIEFMDMQTDTPDYSHTENCAFRPAIHFTARFGWLNDPNGLVQYTSPFTGEKTWHMFFQHNPYSRFWGNMHWGHATSKDLFHWEQQENALYPDEKGTMFSGSAVIDKENRSGLKVGDDDVMLLFYTAAGSNNKLSKGAPFTQCLAYSNDGGKTFRKYEKNPVVKHIVDANRDPKVIWCEEMQCYIMALYLEKNMYTILTSRNFLEWDRLQDIEIAGDAECPDIYPFYANDDPKERKWVIMGASSRYLVLECTKQGFEVIQEARPLRYDLSIYASQTFSDVSDGRRINISWNARGFTFPNAPFGSQMGAPVKMCLKKNCSGYYLCVEPVEELLQLAEKTENYENLALKEEECFALELTKKPYYITIGGLEQKSAKISMQIFGCPIEIDIESNVIAYKEKICPLSVMRECSGLKMIIDKRSIEFITEDGAAIMTVPVFCDYNICKLEITADKDMVIGSMTVTRLQEIFH